MAWPRFFTEHLPASGVFQLDEDESRHASNVLRMATGDVCLAFDGCGGEAKCTVTQLSKRAVELGIVERLDTDREVSKSIRILVALPKGDRQKTLVDSLVQLGVQSLQPLITSRGVAQPVDSALARLRRNVIESSKQCGRNRLMEIAEAVTLDQLSQQLQSGNELRIFAHPYGDVVSLSQVSPAVTAADSVTALIGPEGGFTDEEANTLRSSGWTALTLGPRIMRVEVAATFISSWLTATIPDLSHR